MSIFALHNKQQEKYEPIIIKSVAVLFDTKTIVDTKSNGEKKNVTVPGLYDTIHITST